MAADTVEGTDRASREKRPLALLLSLAGAALLLFLLLVWPTLYRYPKESDRHRVNRLTGKAQVYDRKTETWRPLRGRNSRGTEGSPYDARGPRSEGPAAGGEWWHEGEGSASGSRKAKGSQWWYSEEDEARAEPPSDGSPIGSSRGRGGPGGRTGGGGGGGSPIGGSRSGGGSPVGGGGSGGGSPIGGD